MRRTKTIYTTIEVDVEMEVEYYYQPYQPASCPDGKNGPMLDPPVDEEIEVYSVKEVGSSWFNADKFTCLACSNFDFEELRPDEEVDND